MKRMLVWLLTVALLTCMAAPVQSLAEAVPDSAPIEFEFTEEEPEFRSLSDPALLQYIEDSVAMQLEAELGSDNYVIENVTAIYISQEYLDEVAYNSQSNIYFGYTLAELDAQFDGTRYVFDLGDDGQTIVKEFEEFQEDDLLYRVLKNVAIGTGVILICVTVSVLTAGGVAPAVSAVFATAAQSGALAASFARIGGLSAGVIKLVQTGDLEEALREAVLTGSEQYKWGAIAGSITGGVGKAVQIYRANKTIPTWQQSQLYAWEKYGGEQQPMYLNGKKVPGGTGGATKPDIVRWVGDRLEALEVKNYNLTGKANKAVLLNELEREVSARVLNLPVGSTQRIVLDVRGRYYSTEVIESITDAIHLRLDSIYPNIPIDILRW